MEAVISNFTQCATDMEVMCAGGNITDGDCRDPYCYCYTNTFEAIYLDDHFPIRTVFIVLFVVSVICLLVVSLTIFFDKRLRSHPQPLIAYICLAEAMMKAGTL